VEARFEGGQDQEGAVAPYMDGWMDIALLSQSGLCKVLWLM
jgi:hypothetical protein